MSASSCQTTAEKEGSGWAYDGKEWKDVKGAEWRHPQGPKSSLKGKAEHPVVQVTWQDAQAYCQWLNQAHGGELPEGWVFRLPTEAEWEKAGRGEYGQEWPWGNEFDPKKCNSSEGGANGTTPVGAYSPQGDSPYGAADMVGNVWEWTHTLYRNYPYQAKDGRKSKQGTNARVLRGGSFTTIEGTRAAPPAARAPVRPSRGQSVFGWWLLPSTSEEGHPRMIKPRILE